MSEEFDTWDPMSDDYQSIAFNSYSSGQTAAHLTHNLVPVLGSESNEIRRPPKLYIEGFPSDLTEAGLKNFLLRIGCKPLSVRLVNSKKQSFGRRFSFVDFETTREAQRAVELISSQKLYKLIVGFASTQSDRQKFGDVIEKEKQSFQRLLTKQFEMKQKIDIGNRLAINTNNSSGSADNSSLSPIQSEAGSQDSFQLDLLSPLAKSDKLLKILAKPEDECSFCSQSDPLEHLHFILSEQLVIDPTQLPDLIDILNICHTCGRKAVDMKVCSQCKSTTYCDRDCQSKHWNRHRSECKPDFGGYLSLNSTLNSSKLLNGSVSEVERNGETIKRVSKPVERSEPERDVSKKVSEVSKTKTSAQIRITPRESPPLVAGQQQCAKTVDDVVDHPSIVLRGLPQEPEVEKVVKESVPQPLVKSVEKPPQESTKLKVTPIKQTVDTEILTDGEEGVVLCFGRNPFDFYLQKQTAEENMCIFADEIYKKMNDFPQLSEEELKKGALCGGIYSMDGSCYRARIVDKVNDNTYALYFIDYGNTERVEKKDIKRLPQIFFTCRAQAIRCTLTNIVPKGNVWSKNAISLFGEIGESNEYSKVKIFEKTNDGVFKIDLINSKGESIREKFFDKGFAIDPNEAPKTASNQMKTPESSPKRGPQTPVVSDSPIAVQSSPKVTFNKSSVNDIAVNNYVQPIPKPVFQMETTPKVVLKSFIETAVPNSPLSIMVTNVHNAEEFQYFGTVFDQEVQELIEGLASNYPSSKATVVPKPGDIVVAQGSDDECYRSYVLNVELRTATVFMFDSGFVEKVTKDKIFRIDDQYMRFAVYGVLLMPNSPKGARLIELCKAGDQTIDGTFLRRGNQYILQKDSDFINLLDFKSMIAFIEENDVPMDGTDEEKGGDPFNDLPLRQLPLKKWMEAFALYQDPNDLRVFYVAGDADVCSELMSECSQYATKFDDNIRVNPLRGEVYLVRSTGDMEWYRGRVYSVNGDKVSVKYIDFGNEEEIDINYIMELSGGLQITKIAPLAVKCKVESTKLSDDELTTKIANATEGSYLLKMEVLRVEDGVHYVKVR